MRKRKKTPPLFFQIKFHKSGTKRELLSMVKKSIFIDILRKLKKEYQLSFFTVWNGKSEFHTKYLRDLLSMVMNHSSNFRNRIYELLSENWKATGERLLDLLISLVMQVKTYGLFSKWSNVDYYFVKHIYWLYTITINRTCKAPI